MLKKQIISPEDLKEAAIIERRRQYEESRKKRIFNAKQRLYGQDYEALNRQVQEKRQSEQHEAEIERKWDSERQRITNVINAKEHEVEQEKRRQMDDLLFYRYQHQRKEDSREYDLNDPKRRNEAARKSDNDPNLGISSAQVFLGEDMMESERKKLQKQQLKSWLEQQMKEKKQAEADRNHADILLHNAMNARDKLALEMAALERNNALRMQFAVLNYNRQMAAEQNGKKYLAKKHEEEDNKAEIYNMITSDMLTQNPDVAQSRIDLNRKIPFEYRGMSADELENIKKEQQKQIEERKRIETDEKYKEKMWEQLDMNITETCMKTKMEEQNKLKQQIIDLKAENARLAAEQKTKNSYVNNVLYANECTDEFFNQFNKTSR